MADLYTKERDLQYPATGLGIETIKGCQKLLALASVFQVLKLLPANIYCM